MDTGNARKGEVMKEPLFFDNVKIADSRGHFIRLPFMASFADLLQQFNSSFSKKGTFRGMHFQYPHWQGKLVTVLHGAIKAFILDLRTPSYEKVQCFKLSAGNSLWIPEKYAHGFYALEDSVICY